MDAINIIDEAKSIFDTEIVALEKTKQSLNDNFENIVNVIMQCKGKLIITGIGKSGHIGSKMAATFSSLGTPSFFLHPAEAQHGDLGMVRKEDTVILLSHSGESAEVVNLLPTLQKIGCILIAFTGREKSTLAQKCQYKFVFPEFSEACYMNLAPTSSTTALIALGDALAIVVARLKSYTKENFAFYHPSGSLGKKLLMKVSDIMYIGDKNAVVKKGSLLRNAIVEMSTKGLNMVAITDDDNRLLGIITDGDLRRMLERNLDVYTVAVDDVMTRNPKRIKEGDMAVNALHLMNDKRITCLPVVDDNEKVIGAVLMQDILKVGIE